jgi:D-alanyl-lipoteichoic acid acyltransferase DltB (MBOAT superfamily)
MVTTLTIVTAARLADLDRVVRAGERSKLELFLWFTSPVARFIPRTSKARRANRRRALGYLFRGLLKRLSWQALAYFMQQIPAEAQPWALKSSCLILFFVLNITAAADVLCAATLALGADIDEVFDAPLLAQSPRDFWSRRWNKFIHRFALKHVAIPLGRRLSPAWIVAIVFAISGAFHEYFAWGVGGSQARHGLMMLFFALQAAIVWAGSLRGAPWLTPPVDTIATFGWMVATAPLFFGAISPALWSFGYPPAWTPQLSFG